MIISIDPSVNNVGWAALQERKYYWGLIQPEYEALPMIISDIWRKLELALIHKGLRITDCSSMVYEYPEFFASSKGAIAAQKGYTNNLAGICGGLIGRFQAIGVNPMDCHGYKPNIWKGNLNKKAIEYRFRRLFGEKATDSSTDHEQEAVMLLRYHDQKVCLEV